MNNLGITWVWCALQVTLFAMAASTIYAVRRRSGPRAASAVLLTSLVMIAVITVMAFCSWNGLWNVFPSATQRAEKASGPSTANVSTADDGLPEASQNLAPKSSGRAADPMAVYASEFWRSFLRELEDVRTQDAGFSLRWPVVWAGVVALCAALGIVRLMAGLFAIKKYRAESRSIQDAALADMTRGLGLKLGICDEVELRESSRLTTAATVGWRRPLILLPCQWREWTDQERRAVLAHELAHIRARDFPGWIAAQIGVVLHFYHPWVHWLAGRLRLEQELAADAVAAELAGGSRAYLETLGHMALRESSDALSWPARNFLPSRKTFMRRIEMLRKSPVSGARSAATSKQLGIVGLVVVMGLVISGIRISGVGGQQASAAAPPSGEVAPANARKAPAQEASRQHFDLSLVPENALVVMGIRPAEIFGSPEMKSVAELVNQILDLDPSNIGIPVEEIEQFLFVNYGEPTKGVFKQSIARSRKPLNVEKIQGQWAQAFRPLVTEAVASKTFYRLQDAPDGPGFALVDPQTIVFANTAGLKALLERQPAQLRRPSWAERWDAMDTGQFMLAVDGRAFHNMLASNVSARDLRNLGGGFSLQMVGPVLKETQIVMASASIADPAKLVGLALCETAEGATRVQETLQALLVLGRNVISEQRRTLGQLPQQQAKGVEALFDLSDQLLAGAKIVTKGVNVELQTSSQLSPAAAIQFLLPVVAAAREPGRRTHGVNNLRQIAIAMHYYHDKHGSLPPAVLYGPDGKTPHSWRVAILPYVEGEALYKEYKLDEPWDSPHNLKLLEKIPAVYRSPNDVPGSTNAAYFALTGPETVFSGKEGVKLIGIRDGTSNTVMLVEAKRDIPWTKPEDIPYEKDKPLPMFGGFHEAGYSAAFCDGSVQFISKSIDEPVLSAMITKDGGEPNPFPLPAVAKP